MCVQPVVVTNVRDGATRSGLICTLSYVLEQLKVEHDVDIFQSVRHARINRPQIVPVFVSLLLFAALLSRLTMLSHCSFTFTVVFLQISSFSGYNLFIYY